MSTFCVLGAILSSLHVLILWSTATIPTLDMNQLSERNVKVHGQGHTTSLYGR
jgi:hypothetical protein